MGHFHCFFRCGIFGFCGGQATVPLIEEEVVDTYNWLTIGEFTDAYAFGNTVPGPITTKIAVKAFYFTSGDMKFSAIAFAISVIAAVALFKFEFHPIVTIVAALIFGGLFL